MGRTACTEPHCLYKGALYFFFNRRTIPSSALGNSAKPQKASIMKACLPTGHISNVSRKRHRLSQLDRLLRSLIIRVHFPRVTFPLTTEKLGSLRIDHSIQESGKIGIERYRDRGLTRVNVWKTTTDITRTTRTTAPRSSTHVTPNIHVDTRVHRNHFTCESQHTL